MNINEKDRAVYQAEEEAFVWTPLGDRFRHTSLQAETRQIAAHPSIAPLVGVVVVEDARADMRRAAAYAKGNVIRFAPGTFPRSLVTHELAHVMHRRSGLGGHRHGPAYRACLVALTSSAYGAQYGAMLRDMFEAVDLPLFDVSLPVADTPVIDLDTLARAGSRWL